MTPLELQARYYLEHKAIPNAFFQSGAQLMLSLMNGSGQTIRGFYAKAEAANPDYHCPYSAEQFSVSHRLCAGRNGSMMMFRIGLPEPEQSPLCRAIYLCYSKHGMVNQCYTSELSPEGTYFVCSWTAFGAHVNYGEAVGREEDYIEKLYWNSQKSNTKTMKRTRKRAMIPS